MMSAAVPIAIPIALIAEMMLITLCDFFAIRYLPAMNGANFIFNYVISSERGESRNLYFFSSSSICST